MGAKIGNPATACPEQIYQWREMRGTLALARTFPPLRFNRMDYSSNIKVAIGLRQGQDSKILNYIANATETP